MTTVTAPTAPKRRLRLGLTWVFVVSALEVMSLLFGAGPPFQPVLSILFVATCPGFLLFELEHPADRVAQTVLGIAASLSVNMLFVTVALVGDRTWIVPAIVATLAGLAFLPRYQLGAVVGNLGADAGVQKNTAGEDDELTFEPIDLNRATAGDLASLPFLNANLAQAVVAYRTVHGPFMDFDDVLGVRGIGPSRLANLRANTFLSATDSIDDETQEEH